MKSYRELDLRRDRGHRTDRRARAPDHPHDRSRAPGAGRRPTPPTSSRSHTVSVDTTRALLFCNGTRMDAAGTRAPACASCRSRTPRRRSRSAWWPGGTMPVPITNYVHDCVPVGNRLYASSIYVGIQRILDFTNPARADADRVVDLSRRASTPQLVARRDRQLPLRHRRAERPDAPRVRHLEPRRAGAGERVSPRTRRRSSTTRTCRGTSCASRTTPRACACSTSPTRAHPAEFGWADTYPGASGGYDGVWGVCPYFPSGTVIASDMQTGLYVFRPMRELRARAREWSSRAAAMPRSPA